MSSSEAEYVAISELVKEIEFARQLLEHFKVKMELPIPVFVDNVGAIQMVRNNASGAGTRHVNCRFHYTRELHEQGIIIMYFRRSELNESDAMTKNATQKEFEEHAPKWVGEVPEKLMAKVKKEGGC